MARRIFRAIVAASSVVWVSHSASAATLTRGPYLQIGTPTSMTVRWRTDVASDSRVSYGTVPGNPTTQVDDATLTTEHVVRLTGLSPGTQYYYAIGSTSQVLAGGDAQHVFLTAPSPGTPKAVRVWVIGDSGTANASAAAVRDAYLGFTGSRYTDVWLMLGDNAYNDGTDSQYQSAVFNMYPALLRQTVLWPTLGNHDGHSASSTTQTGPYYDIFTLPKMAEAGGLASGTEAYYSFDHANVHFICLDSHDSDRSPGGAMLTWLQNDLAATTKKWIIAYWHHPPYSKGSHDSDTSSTLRQMRENVLPILESYGVDLVLSGHSHSYERSFQLHGHYGTSGTLTSAMLVDSGDGREDGTGAYQKLATGAVYVVAGSSGKTSGGALNHPVMYLSLNQLGSLVLDINGDRLDATFVNNTGGIQDYLTILKAPQGNQAPTVNAGADQAVILPASASLDGTVTDDGLPSPPGAVTTTWSPVSGPGTVTFANANAVDTTASFLVAGSYVLQFTADDGDLAASDTVTITVWPEGTMNGPPVVDAGPDLVITYPATATLDGTVTDDGLPSPPGAVSTTWSQVSGPGTVSFANATAVDTTASFSAAGTYTVRLTASDSALAASDEVTITVQQGGATLDIRVKSSADDAEESSTGSVSLTSSDLELVYDTSNQQVGMRFTGVSIPRGASITNAYIQFKVDETGSTATSLTIRAQASDNAPTFTTASGNISARPKTTAAVAWAPPAWPTVGVAGPDQRTPNIAAVLQEVVNRPGWASGNALVLIITGTGTGKRTAESYNGDQAGAPLLHVEYGSGGAPPPPVNAPPVVGAGPDQTITLPATATLDGTVTDDGLPTGSTLTTTWSQLSGPGTVSFANANAVDTTASFSVAGSYTLRLTASDSALSASDDISITVNPAPPQSNQPPTVSAGPDQVITYPATATLDGTVTDDGLPSPPGAVSTTWSQVSGPGTVSFANANAVDTTASFSVAGTYGLRLTASDSALAASDEVTITVQQGGATLDIRVKSSADDAEESSTGSVSLTSSDLELVFDGSNQQVGMRFTGVSIPRGAAIINAHIQFKVDEATSGTIALSIRAQAGDNAPTFTTASGNISSRPKTTAAVSWAPPAWPTVGVAGPDQRTPNIAAVIQEVVNRSGWASGNALVLIITGTGKRTAESYNGDQAGAPLLHIEYTF